jgi:toluene monooxygenase system protein E
MSARELRAQRVRGAPRRTYACLEGRGRKPTDYEITTTALLYYPPRGFEVETPVWRHHQAYQLGGKLSCVDWDAFEDPRHTTYSSYVAARRDQEALLDHLFASPPAAVSAGLARLAELVSALRFPLHGLQMVSSYVGALAPSGRIAVVAALQAADEVRRIQRLCQWLARSGAPLVELDRAGRALWQEHRALQPLRRVIERLLVTYAWEEALVGLNGVLKPALEQVLGERLGAVAARHGDQLLGGCVRSFAADAAWHAACYEQLERLLTEGNARNAEVLGGMKQQLKHAIFEACEAAATLLESSHGEGGKRDDTV